jgi:1-acyl-sn-glycerol-3-phosphate acyltransferase
MVLPRRFDPRADLEGAPPAADATGPAGAMRPWYRFVHLTAFALARIFCGLRVHGLENLPAPPFIVAANHISLFDPPILGGVVPYEVAFMAKVELFRKPLLGPLIRSLNAFPVKRGLPDREAIDRALETLRGGRALILFPEGTRDRSAGPIRAPKSGVGLFAVSAQLSVVPVYMEGTNRFSRALLRAPRFRVTFGTPIAPPPAPPAGDLDARRLAYEAVASAWLEAVEALRERAGASRGGR